MAALPRNSTISMKPHLTPANDIETRRAGAKRTAMIVGAIAVALFVFSILEVALSK